MRSFRSCLFDSQARDNTTPNFILQSITSPPCLSWLNTTFQLFSRGGRIHSLLSTLIHLRHLLVSHNNIFIFQTIPQQFHPPLPRPLRPTVQHSKSIFCQNNAPLEAGRCMADDMRQTQPHQFQLGQRRSSQSFLDRSCGILSI
ncbi:hypothetical protein BLNAU_16004 [Blattamonas nauphoetae]|uniref:Uncharacterized protein n=1 Tax=Blattamonas nauphoetae TaxID=2049346 RepID=A0ABQ9XBL1_9EUKA|nr:hypothetical protein BLNAU_16004 [Blattamonas nauphoetae]